MQAPKPAATMTAIFPNADPAGMPTAMPGTPA